MGIQNWFGSNDKIGLNLGSQYHDISYSFKIKVYGEAFSLIWMFELLKEWYQIPIWFQFFIYKFFF